MEHLLELVKVLLEKNIFMAFMLAYLGGVLTTFTPCVYPMIPVTLAITLGTETVSEKDKWKKLVNPFFYCLGITVTYALLGILAAATGTFFGKWAGNPWLYFVLGLVFLFLAGSLLEIVHLPTWQFQYRTDRASKFSLFLFGALTGVIFSPCTAPMLGLFLTYAATKNILGGGLLLFGYAAGFSSVLLGLAAVSLYAKEKIPRSGAWLNGVKWTIAVFCLLLAGYLFYQAYAAWKGGLFF